MKAIALVKDSNYRQSLKEISSRFDFKVLYVDNIIDFFEKSLEQPPRIFFIQNDSESNLEMIDLIRDIRILFGSSPNLILIGKEDKADKMADFLGMGADSFFSIPFDESLLEDFFAKNLNKEMCRPFKFRNLPSGGNAIKMELQTRLLEVNSNGVRFESDFFISKNVIFDISLDEKLKLNLGPIRLRILKNSRNSEYDFEYFAEYYEFNPDDKKKLIFSLKNK